MTTPSVKPTSPFIRTRSLNTMKASTPCYEVAAGPVANSTQLSWWNAPTGKTATMVDTVIPGFHRLKAAGQILFNPMSRAEVAYTGQTSIGGVSQISPSSAIGQTYAITGDWVSWALAGSSSSGSTTIPSSLLPVSLISASTADRAISEACTKAQRLPSDANLLVSIAELHKTLRLVPDLWSNWSRFFQSFHGKVEYLYTKRLVSDPRRQSAANLQLLREVTQDTWLAMRFGVRPLIMDTLGVLKALDTQLSGGPLRVTQRGNVLCTGSSVATAEGAYGVLRYQLTKAQTHNYRVRAMNLFEIALDNYQRRTGLSIGAIPEAVIDLVSYSFVANWMVTLNDFFSAIGSTIDPGIRNLGGCYTIIEENSIVYQTGGGYSTDARYVMSLSPIGVSTASIKNRWRFVGLRSPSITIRANPFKFLTDLRLLDSVALLSKSIKRPIRF